MGKALIVACFMAASAAALSADQTPIAPAENAKLGALRQPGRANGYRGLFETREALGRALADQSGKPATAPKKTIVCGMTVIEVGPELDPKMGATPPKDDDVRYTIRAVPPPVCGAPR